MIYDPRWADAIGQIESSGNYGALGPVMKSGDRAYGKYQVMGSNVPAWTQQALGYSMSPQEFLGNSKAQDAVFQKLFGGYADKYGNPQDAASAWFTGRPLARGGNASDGYINGNEYVSRFNKALGNPQMMASADPNTTGALSPSAQLGTGALGTQGADNTPWYQQLTSQGVSNGLIGAGAALASISSPQQAAALTGLLKTNGAGGSFSVHVDPKTGKGVRVNSKTGEVVPFQAFTPVEDNEYNKKYDDENAKKMSDYGTDLSKSAGDATNTLSSIQNLRQVLQDPNLYQGTGGALHQQAAKLFSAMGFGDPSTVANGDIATALSNKLALQMMNQGGSKLLPGSFSDSDRAFVQQMGTSLNNSPAANQRLLDIMERGAQRTLEANQLAQSYMDSHNGRLDYGFRREETAMQNRWAKENKQIDKQYTNAPTTAPNTKRPSLDSIFN